MEIHPIDGEVFVSSASTQYSHGMGFVGSAASESMDADTDLLSFLPDGTQAELREGTAVGYSLYKEGHYDLGASVYIVPKLARGTQNLSDLASEHDGTLPVIEVVLGRGLDLDEFVRAAFNRFSVEATRFIGDAPVQLQIVGRAAVDDA